ncbi:MAG: universal stress protein [Ectobacillus sp.]
MKQSILVPVDGSEHANKALQFALTIAKGVNARIILLNVQPSLKSPNIQRYIGKAEIKKYQEEMGEFALDRALSAIGESEVPITSKIRTGYPTNEILLEAKEQEVFCIIMGSRGMNPLTGKLLGSVSYGVLHDAPCPVTIVH